MNLSKISKNFGNSIVYGLIANFLVIFPISYISVIVVPCAIAGFIYASKTIKIEKNNWGLLTALLNGWIIVYTLFLLAVIGIAMTNR